MWFPMNHFAQGERKRGDRIILFLIAAYR